MLRIPISPLIAAFAVHFGAFRILLIAVFSAFCNLSISYTFMSITSATCSALASTTPFQYVFPIITRWQLFSMTEFVKTLNLLIFSLFRSFALQTHFFLLVLSLFSILFLLLLLYYLFFHNSPYKVSHFLL